jgi:protease I
MTKINQDLSGRKVCIMATDGFEQSELLEPLDQLKEAGAEVKIASLKEGEIRGWNKDDWGQSVSVDQLIADTRVDDFDALVLPGGQINPDLLRVDKDAVALVREFNEAGKPIAAICHGPWLLVEAGLAKNRNMTSYKSIRTDLANAGARVLDEQVVIDGNFITSRNPDDLDAFCEAIADMLVTGAEVDLKVDNLAHA